MCIFQAVPNGIFSTGFPYRAIRLHQLPMRLHRVAKEIRADLKRFDATQRILHRDSYL
jgi:hypothetical protein